MGSPKPSAGSLFPVVADRVFRRHRFGTRHRVARGGFAGGPALSAPRPGRARAGSLDDVAHAPTDRCGDASRGVHVGPAAPRGRRSLEGSDGRDRRHHLGSQCRDAEYRATGYGGSLPGVSDPPCRRRRHQHPDAGGAGALRPQAKEEDLQQRTGGVPAIRTPRSRR